MSTERFAAELRATREGALLQPPRDLAAFAVTGNDRLSWLNGLVTCEVAKLQPGAGAYGLAVGKTGRIMAELWFLAAADRVLVGLARDRVAVIREHFERHLIMEDAEMSAPLDRDVPLRPRAPAPGSWSPRRARWARTRPWSTGRGAATPR